jgi:membrane-bound lytic murein transglycosylase F
MQDADMVRRRWTLWGTAGGAAWALLLAAGCSVQEKPRISGADTSAAASHAAEEVEPSFARDIVDIQSRDTLVVLSPYNSTTYFLFRGEPMGYEYELLREFAKDIGVTLKVVVVNDRDSLFSMLNSGRGDIAAARLIPLRSDSGRVKFTRALYRTDPVLVQQAAPASKAARALPDPVDTILKRGPAEAAPRGIAVRVRPVSKPDDLVDQKVSIPKKSPYSQTLIELADSLTGDIYVAEVDASSEALIREVSKGNVAYTVTEGNLADLQTGFYRNLKVRPVIGQSRQVAWAVRRNAPKLLSELDRWIADEKTGPLFDRLYKKYFVDRRGYEERVKSRYLMSETGTLSPYDHLLKRYADSIGWDWRLLGSQMYQESRFRPNAKSWAGAVGLLQLMPATGRQFGVRNPLNPEDNVRGAVRFLQWLTRYWTKRLDDPGQRLQFILASYNTGAGHVEDAQRLAEKHGDHPKKWNDVAYWLMQKSKREIYTDPVVKYGFSRGVEPVTYVAIILDRFDHYRQYVVKEAPAKDSTKQSTDSASR